MRIAADPVVLFEPDVRRVDAWRIKQGYRVLKAKRRLVFIEPRARRSKARHVSSSNCPRFPVIRYPSVNR